MSEKKNLDEFLRDTLNRLPNTPVGDFKKVENKLKAKNHQNILILLLVPFVFSGLYWLGGFTEKDFYFPDEQHSVSPLNQNQPPKTEARDAQFYKQNSSELEAPSTAKKEQSVLAKTEKNSPKKTATNAIVANHAAQPAHAPKAEILLAETEIEPASVLDLNSEPEQTTMAFVAVENEVLPTNNILLQAETAATAPEQITVYDVRETSKVSVNLNVYPNYTFREFKINSMYQSQVNDRYEDIIKASEKGGFAFNAGIDVRYHLGDNLFIGSGLGLIQTKINGSYNYEVGGEPVIDGNGNIYMYAQFIEPFEVNQGIIQTYRFLQLPLHVSYQPWISQKLRLIAEGGFSYIRFLSAEGKTVDHQSLALKELNTMYYNKNMATMDFKIGLTFYPNPNVAFGIEPTLMYFNSSIYASDFPVYVVPWSVGVNLNVRLRLY